MFYRFDKAMVLVNDREVRKTMFLLLAELAMFLLLEKTFLSDDVSAAGEDGREMI